MKSLDALDRRTLTKAGIAVGLVLFVAINIYASIAFQQNRVDFTEGRLYTLSEGTRKLLDSIDEPITMRFYFSRSLVEKVPAFGNYAKRVREMLENYVSLSRGKLRLMVYNPEPYSPEEDEAVSFSLQGVPIDQSGELAYFGLAATNSTDDKQAIPFFNSDREPFLEYDVSRLLYNLANPEKKTIGIMTSLPVWGDPSRGIPSWAFTELLNQIFRVRTLDSEVTKIDDDIDVLMVIHPRGLSEATQYALDQFVLRGGRAMVFVDPFAEMGGMGQPQRMPDETKSTMDRLFAAWGLDFNPEMFAADRANAIRVTIPGPTGGGGRDLVVDYLSWLQMGPANLAPDDVATTQIQRVNMASSGFLVPREGRSTEIQPLISTSPQSMRMEAKEIRIVPNPIGLMEKFKSENRRLVLAVRVRGKVATAFPDGPPSAEAKEPTKEGTAAPQGRAQAAPAKEVTQLKESTGPVQLVVFADSDLLADQMWFRQQDFFGQRVIVPTANNVDLVINLLDNLVGSNALIGLRGRGFSVRPFDRIDALQRDAELRYRHTERTLRDKLNDTQRKLGDLETQQRPGGGEVILTEEQKTTLTNFRSEVISLRQQLRQVQHALRKDIEDLNTAITIINIWSVPVIISIVALIMAILRRRRYRRHVVAG